MKFKPRIIDKIIAVTTLLLCVFHFIAMGYYGVKDAQSRQHSNLPIEGSLDSFLIFIHFIFLLLVIGYFCTLLRKTLLSKIFSLFISLTIFSVYLWWYRHTCSLLATEGTEEYYWQLSEFGILRGAAKIDYWVFFITLSLVVYAAFKVIRKFLYNRVKLK